MSAQGDALSTQQLSPPPPVDLSVDAGNSPPLPTGVKLTKKGVERKPHVMTPARMAAFEKCQQALREKRAAAAATKTAPPPANEQVTASA